MYNNSCRVERLSFDNFREKTWALKQIIYIYFIFSNNFFKVTHRGVVGEELSLFNVRSHRAEKHSHVFQLFGFAT